METLARLPAPCCILLAIRLASESNIAPLRTLCSRRQDALPVEILLSVLLTYLPETTDPSSYTTLVQEVVSDSFDHVEASDSIDTSAVNGLSAKRAQKRVQKANLLPLPHPTYSDAPNEPLTNFLIHRSHRIDAETGLLDLIPHLVLPFIESSTYLRTWFISTVLPLLRHDYEYYPQSVPISLDSFASLSGQRALDTLLSHQQSESENGEHTRALARDLRGLVGPWVYGATSRKRRRTGGTAQRRLSVAPHEEKGERTGTALEIESAWDHVFGWIVHTASEGDFSVVIQGIDEWDGPEDVDFGGYEESSHYLDDEVQQKLERRYGQAAIGSIYAVDKDSLDIIQGAHSLLVRLARLIDAEHPPDLAASVAELPTIDSEPRILSETSPSLLQYDALLKPDQPLTSPNEDSFDILQMFVYTAYILHAINQPLSITNVAKFRLRSDREEQLHMLQKILHTSTTQMKRDDGQWQLLRDRLLWLWGWGSERGHKNTHNGVGIFGKIPRDALEQEILKALLNAGRTSLATKIYVQSSQPHGLASDVIERAILEVILHYYDTASNGNKTRGTMKKASDLLSTFRPFFKQSSFFRQTEALLAATHALSFYSLTLQRGVPFQPVNIRIRSDPLTLVKAILEQNPRSYTKLDDLSSIGEQLVSAGLEHSDGRAPLVTIPDDVLKKQRGEARRRVIGMAIEAALNEDDFETAYSYVTTRLNTSSLATPTVDTSTDASRQTEENPTWRAAFLAGRHEGTPMSSSYTSTGSGPNINNSALRRIEQRMELLSQALMLAPPSALPEVLGVWQECEAEMSSINALEAEEEQRFNDRADRRLPGEFIHPNTFVQPRREVGRGAVEESPMGLFDVARGAAAAFSRNATGLSGGLKLGGQAQGHTRTASIAKSDSESITSDGEEQRVRKRDMLSNAVTGGLASGLGWVLGEFAC